MTFLSRLLGFAALSVTTVAPTIARADAPLALPVDVSHVIESSYAWFEARTSAANDRVGTRAADGKIATAASTPAVTSVSYRPLDKPSVEAPPVILNPPIRLSLVARDWGRAYGIAGRTTVTDELRLSRSSRMLVGRAKLDLGNFQPFIHVALGEWRYDPTLLPILPSNQEYASQTAAGFELRIAKYARIAVEVDHTLLLRETREPQNNPEANVFGAFAVMSAKY
jgi:hypothetical protein